MLADELAITCTSISILYMAYMMYGILISILLISMLVDVKKNKSPKVIMIGILILIIASLLYHITPCYNTLFFIEIAFGAFISFILLYREYKRNLDIKDRDNIINKKTIDIFKLILKNLRNEKNLISIYYGIESSDTTLKITSDKITAIQNQHKINIEYAKNLILISNNTMNPQQISESIKMCTEMMLSYDFQKIDTDIGIVSHQIQNLEQILLTTFNVKPSDIDDS